ncbi:maltokinase N-terminal cap-like domain-containing protein [Nocardioides sp. LHG3406-4]|uniref:maltokinase N-terminal cap-like domain-containing protein n=1 Tax=Nocardioides sp. LHG3406-4 TaxID=2804575 RepID=UPI003CF73C0F
MTDSETTHPQLEAYLEAARWFGGKGRGARVTGIDRIASLDGSPLLTVDLITVAYADGGADEVYQLPLGNYAEPEGRLEHALVGSWYDGRLGHHVFAYDALHDRDAMARYLQAFAETDATREVGGLTFHRLPGHECDTEAHSTLFTGEQSNSSVAFGEDSVLKVFRKITPGPNPDIAVHEVLTRAGSEHVAHLYGWVEAPAGDEVLQLAMLQQFLRTASDGWELAQASVRNLLTEGDLHADEVGGDFAGEAARLGVALAETHEVLAEHFPTHVRTPAEMGELAASMHARLDAALEVAPPLSAYEPALRTAYDAVASLPGSLVQTVHGDLHLGQTLRTVKGWKIVDFEGEPARPLAERMLPDSRWRDVAGMLRSFDYAPRVAAMIASANAVEGDEQRDYRAREWAARNREAFLTAYAGRTLDDDERTLLDAYIADKAVYEAVYEVRNRPAWVTIPLEALEALGAAADDEETR